MKNDNMIFTILFILIICGTFISVELSERRTEKRITSLESKFHTVTTELKGLTAAEIKAEVQKAIKRYRLSERLKSRKFRRRQ